MTRAPTRIARTGDGPQPVRAEASHAAPDAAPRRGRDERGGGGPSPPPQAPPRFDFATLRLHPDRPADAVARPLPYLREMEHAFGRPLGDVQAHTGKASELGRWRARALAAGNVVAFADAAPPRALVAHEVAHVLQGRNAGAAPPGAVGSIGARDGLAEREADHIAALVAARGLGTALPAVAAVPAAQVHLAPPAPDVAASNGVEPIAGVELVSDDRFRLELSMQHNESTHVAMLVIEIRYAGSDDSDGHQVAFEAFATWGRPPAPRVEPDRPGDWAALDIDLYGDGTHVTRVTHAVRLLDGWSPKSRAHQFAVNGRQANARADEIVIKSREAVPASSLRAQGPNPPAADALRVRGHERSSLPSNVAAVAATRLLDELVNQTPHAALGRLQRRVHADRDLHARAEASDPAAARGFSRLIEAIEQVRPMLQALELASHKEAYLADIADSAVRLVSDVKQLYGAALEQAYDSGAGDRMLAADRAFDAVWFRIASLYLQSGRGVGTLIQTASSAVHDVREARSHAGRGAVYWWALESQLGVEGTRQRGRAKVEETGTKAQQIREDFLAGQTGSLSRLVEVIEDAQRITGLAGLLACNEAFHAFRTDLDGIVGGAFDHLGRNISHVCADYNAQFEAILDDAERALRSGTGFQKVGKAAVDRFLTIVRKPEFRQDLAAIASRVKWVKAIEIVGKVLMIMAVAALTAGVAGAAVASALEGTGVAAIASYAAEVTTFTLVSRLGNQIAFGKNDTSFAEDLATNALMFGVLKAASRAYGRVFELLADPKLHRTAYAAGGAVTGMISLHAFTEVHFLIKQGRWMDNDDRARAVVQNAAMLLALGLGPRLVGSLDGLIRRKALIFTSERFPERLEQLRARLAGMQTVLDGIAHGDPAAAQQTPDLLKQIEQIWNEEVSVLAEAAKAERTAQAHQAFVDTVNGFVADIARLELQLSQAGIAVDLGVGNAANLFSPLTPGFVAFKPEGKPVLEAYYREREGTFEQIQDNLYSGKAGGVETFYVPQAAVKQLLLDSPDVPGLEDVEAGRPVAGAATDVAAFDRAAAEHAELAGKVVGGPLGAVVAQVERQSLASDIQVESGLRILDPLFGKRASDAFKQAAGAIPDGARTPAQARDASALRTAAAARDRVQKQMLDVLRDPRLELSARKRQLHRLLAEFEREVVRSSLLKADSFGLAEASRQIDALVDGTFKDMLAVDAAGNLTRGGVKIGTLRALMDQVKLANNLMRKNGVARELAISVSSPRDRTIPSEVKILSRTRASLPAGTPRSSVVDPTDQSAPGVTVDIGVGLGNYARSVGGETGELVQTEYGERYADPAMIRRDLTWAHTGPHVDANSVLILGDALQTLPMLFAPRSVKRMFINHVNANYEPGGRAYENLAAGLNRVMAKGGRVEVQWTTEPETTGGVTKSRGHITGGALEAALASTAPGSRRHVSVTKGAKLVLDFDYSIEASRNKSGVASKSNPTNPVPKNRWIFTFGD